MKLLAIWLSGLLLLAPAWAGDKPEAPALSPLKAAKLSFDSRDYQGAEAILKAAMTDKMFEVMTEQKRHAIVLLLAQAAFYAGDQQTAADAIRKACAFSEAGAGDWLLRVNISARSGREDLDDTLLTLAQRYPASLSELNDLAVLQELHRLSRSPHRAYAMRIVKAFFAAGWRPSSVEPDFADELWVRLALFDVEHDDLAAAKTIAAAIHSPNALIEMLADKRFDPVVAADRSHFDIAAAAAASLERAKARMEANPQLLEPVRAVSRALMRLGRNQEALDLVDAALAKVRGGEVVYSDRAYALPWLMELRGTLLALLGRTDAAVAERERAAALPENGTSNVSQTLNLAGKLDKLGRPREALAVLHRLSATNMSPYGRMVLESDRACAYAQLKDEENFAGAMQYLRAHAADAPLAPMRVLIFAKDENGVAKAIISLLEDPATRLQMLFELQDFVGPKNDAAKGDTKGFLAKVLARGEVQAAIEKVGRVQTFPIRLVR